MSFRYDTRVMHLCRKQASGAIKRLRRFFSCVSGLWYVRSVHDWFSFQFPMCIVSRRRSLLIRVYGLRIRPSFFVFWLLFPISVKFLSFCKVILCCCGLCCISGGLGEDNCSSFSSSLASSALIWLSKTWSKFSVVVVGRGTSGTS